MWHVGYGDAGNKGDVEETRDKEHIRIIRPVYICHPRPHPSPSLTLTQPYVHCTLTLTQPYADCILTLTQPYAYCTLTLTQPYAYCTLTLTQPYAHCILTLKLSVDEVFCRRNALSTKCPADEMLFDEVLCRRKFFDKNLSTNNIFTGIFYVKEHRISFFSHSLALNTGLI